MPNVLPLLNVHTFDLFVDDLRSLGAHSQIVYTVSVSDSSVPLKVTIAWYDFPNVDGTSTAALINDLDLLVTSPAGTR